MIAINTPVERDAEALKGEVFARNSFITRFLHFCLMFNPGELEITERKNIRLIIVLQYSLPIFKKLEIDLKHDLFFTRYPGLWICSGKKRIRRSGLF